MSINKTIKVENSREQVVADDRNQAVGRVEDDNIPSIDKSHATKSDEGDKGDYAGRKHQPDIDGPQQDSQETDDVYVDNRETDSDLPPAGKNVGELNAFDLGRHDKESK